MCVYVFVVWIDICKNICASACGSNDIEFVTLLSLCVSMTTSVNALPRTSVVYVCMKRVCVCMCSHTGTADVCCWIACAYFSERRELGHLGICFSSNGPAVASTFTFPTTPREQETPLCLWEPVDIGPYSKNDISGRDRVGAQTRPVRVWRGLGADETLVASC